MPNNRKTISVIIPVKNEQEKIRNCLKMVFNQSHKSFEVIVVDGYSTDKTVEIVREFPAEIFFDDYGTIGGARQIGLEKAKGQYVAFVDADCIPERDWLENLIKEFDNGIVGVGGRIRHAGKGLWEKSIILAMNTFFGSANSVQSRFFKNKRFVKSISGCNSMYRKEDLIKVGGFDPKLSVTEDAVLNRKLSKIGKLLYTPNAIVLHDHGRSLKDFARRIYEYGCGWGRNHLLDLQIVPPLLVLPLLISAVFAPWIFLAFVGLYSIILLTMGLKFWYKEKNPRYVFSIAIVYIIEHLSFTIGFWQGIFEGIVSRQDNS